MRDRNLYQVGPWPQDGAPNRPQFIDIPIFILVVALIWIVGSIGRDMTSTFTGASTTFNLSYSKIPYYTIRSTLRMFIAYGFSLLFTLVVGYTAAHSTRARTLILPALDILQSVPVLGFLSVTVTGFMSLFPGSMLGVEAACIFAIFTAQVWNMTFGFYHSLVTIPRDLTEAATAFDLSPWERFKTVELPSGAISLIWNSMMSFGGGWFFVVQSEAISVLNQKITLPGIGSYLAVALERGDTKAAWMAVLAMVVVVVLIDQIIWRPVVAWSQKYRVELVESDEVQTSWALELGRRSWFLRRIFTFFTSSFVKISDFVMSNTMDRTQARLSRNTRSKKLADSISLTFMIVVIFAIGYESIRLIREIHTDMDLNEVRHIVWLGFLTMCRVFVMVVAATLIWTPIGVWIGFRPKIAKFAQPIAQIAASFPANMTFPFVVGFFVGYHVSINWGSILLLALGTQWYILFNVIAGASSVPSDLKESASVFGLRGWRYWRTLIIPAIFPFWVTGACTAAGGAWNASIVAEYVNWGHKVLVAKGLGAFITETTARGDWPAIFCSILVMAVFVVILNRLLWRNLYDLAERKYRLD